ncbi:hydrogenase maturation protease [Chloroflexota bacterium]
MEHNDIVVAGLGNLLMSDEGIGIQVLRKLIEKSQHLHNIHFVEIGSSVINVIHAIAGRQKAVLIDCAFMEQPAGTILRFSPQEVSSDKSLPLLSLHEGDLLSNLDLSRKLGECPENVVIFGIQPESIAPGESLSPTLQNRLEDYVEFIKVELELSPQH